LFRSAPQKGLIGAIFPGSPARGYVFISYNFHLFIKPITFQYEYGQKPHNILDWQLS